MVRSVNVKKTKSSKKIVLKITMSMTPRVPNPIASSRLSEYTKDEAKSTKVT